MARPTLTGHPKFVRVAAAVGGKAVARGALELIWESAYASGDPFVGDADTLESIADWRGERGALARALHANGNGFLDLGADGYYVHDLEDHAPDYVLKRWERERQRKEKGATIRSLRQAAARASWASRDANDHASVRANGEQLQSNCNADVSPPARARAPAHEESLPAGTPAIPGGPAAPSGASAGTVERGRIAHVGAATLLFLECFGAYPNQNAKLLAAQAWQDVAATFPAGEQGLRNAIVARFEAGMLALPPWDQPRFCVNFERFLRERRWEDPGLKSAVVGARGSPGDRRYGTARAEDQKHTRSGEVEV